MTWREALADCKGTLILGDWRAARELAVEYMSAGVMTPGDYIALARWSEGRSSYAAELWQGELA